MSIHFISGKPGGGKSMYATKLLIEELLHGHRMIITNVPLKLASLNVYLQEKYPEHPCWRNERNNETGILKTVAPGIIDRIWILTDEETAEFWTYRPGGVRIPKLTKDEWRSGDKPSYAEVKDEGVLYCIDEVHNFFGARQWAETGQDVLFYLSQHRKLGDTVICVTQAVANVDKQFRSVSQDFTYLRNIGKERYGAFRLPQVFVRKTFGSPPTETSQPMESGTFRLDVSGIASCYDSAQGVGIHGRSADTGERKKGMHWSLFLLFTAIFTGVVFFAVPHAIGSLFKTPDERMSRPKPVPSVASALPPAGVVQLPPLPLPPLPNQNVSPVNVARSSGPELNTNVWITGFVKIPNSGFRWYLSDGQVLNRSDVGEVTERSIEYRGQLYEFARTKPLRPR